MFLVSLILTVREMFLVACPSQRNFVSRHICSSFIHDVRHSIFDGNNMKSKLTRLFYRKVVIIFLCGPSYFSVRLAHVCKLARRNQAIDLPIPMALMSTQRRVPGIVHYEVYENYSDVSSTTVCE